MKSGTPSDIVVAFWKKRATTSEKAVMALMLQVKELKDQVKRLTAERDVLARQLKEKGG